MCQSGQEIAYFQNLTLSEEKRSFCNDLENVLNTCLIDLKMPIHIKKKKGPRKVTTKSALVLAIMYPKPR